MLIIEIELIAEKTQLGVNFRRQMAMKFARYDGAGIYFYGLTCLVLPVEVLQKRRREKGAGGLLARLETIHAWHRKTRLQKLFPKSIFAMQLQWSEGKDKRRARDPYICPKIKPTFGAPPCLITTAVQIWDLSVAQVKSPASILFHIPRFCFVFLQITIFPRRF